MNAHQAPRRAVYRAVFGGYEQLREEEAARDSALPFICLTDDPNLTSSTWEVVRVEPRFAVDRTRNARALKILGHPVLADFDETLWIDNTVALKGAPDSLFDEWLGNADVAAPLHSFRASVLAEAEAIIDQGRDDYTRVYEQLNHYLSTAHREVLEENPHWTGMLARRHTPETAAAMQVWWEQVLRHSRRDQLSFLPVMRAQGVRLESVRLDNHESSWHEWPRVEGRDMERLGSGLREALRPPAGRIGELQQSLEEASQTLATTVAARERVIDQLEATLADARTAVDTVREEAEVVRKESETARAESHATRAELDTVRHERNLARMDLASTQTRVTDLEAMLAKKSAALRRLRRKVDRLKAEPPPASRWSRIRSGLGGR